MMKYLRLASLATVLSFGYCTAGSAVITTVDCSSPIVIGASQAPNTWYTDRFPPAGFGCNGGELELTISSADSDSNRPPAQSGAFYKTQGRKLDMTGVITWATADLYVDSSWSNTERIAGFWATGVDDSDVLASYPILEYAMGGFRGWDSVGSWSSTTTVTDVGNDGWYTMLMALVGTTIEYYVEGTFLFSADAYGTTSFSNLMLQGINNFGQGETGQRTIVFDNVVAGNNVPEPTGLLLAATALVILPIFSRRAKQRHKAKRLARLCVMS